MFLQKKQCYVLKFSKWVGQNYLIKSIVGNAELNNALACVFWLHCLHGNVHEQIKKNMSDLSLGWNLPNLI